MKVIIRTGHLEPIMCRNKYSNTQNAWGVAIPGLAMNATELPSIPGLVRLQNPEIDGSAFFKNQYSLEDVALFHLKQIVQLNSKNSNPFHVIGMSMGGMIVSILASELRSKLPTNIRFHILVSSPNLAQNPALPEALLTEWRTAKLVDRDDFSRLLSPLFSQTFISKHPDSFSEYFEYRLQGKNGQTAKAFERQVSAIKNYSGEKYYPQLDPSECRFINGLEDRLFDHSHREDQRRLSPECVSIEIQQMGHLVNLERPDLFDLRKKEPFVISEI